MGGPAMGGPAMGGPAMGGPAMGGPTMGGSAMRGSGIGPGMGSPGKGGLSMASPGINPAMTSPAINPGMVAPGIKSGVGTPSLNPGMAATNMGPQYSGPSANPFMQAANIQVQKNIQKMTWSFLHDNGQFVNYDDVTCALIENAYSLNQPSVEFSSNGQTYVINFKHPFSQLSTAGQGSEREVRRNDGTSQPILEKGQAKWLWKHEDGNFREYEPKASLLIERAYQGNRSSVIVWGNNGKAYFITLNGNNCYQENEITHFKKEIRRQNN